MVMFTLIAFLNLAYISFHRSILPVLGRCTIICLLIPDRCTRIARAVYSFFVNGELMFAHIAFSILAGISVHRSIWRVLGRCTIICLLAPELSGRYIFLFVYGALMFAHTAFLILADITFLRSIRYVLDRCRRICLLLPYFSGL